MAGSSDLRAPQFNGTNYDFWAVKMETTLTAYDLWDIVQTSDQTQNPEAEGSAKDESKAKGTSEENQAATKEIRIKNAKALNIIQEALTDELFPRIRNEKHSKRSMRDFEQRIQR